MTRGVAELDGEEDSERVTGGDFEGDVEIDGDLDASGDREPEMVTVSDTDALVEADAANDNVSRIDAEPD